MQKQLCLLTFHLLLICLTSFFLQIVKHKRASLLFDSFVPGKHHSLIYLPEYILQDYFKATRQKYTRDTLPVFAEFLVQENKIYLLKHVCQM